MGDDWPELCEQLASERDAALAAQKEAEEQAKQAREDHHRLGAWPDCPRCTQFFNDDGMAALKVEALERDLAAARQRIAELEKTNG